MKEDKYSQGVIVAVDTLERLVPKLQKFLDQKRTQEAQRCLAKILYSATRAQHLLGKSWKPKVEIVAPGQFTIRLDPRDREESTVAGATLRVGPRLPHEPDFVPHDEEDA